MLYLLGPEALTAGDAALCKRAMEGARFVVLHDTRARPAHGDVDALLPAATFAEVDGTFVNHAYRLQRIRRAYAPLGGARSGIEILADLTEALTGKAARRTASELFAGVAAGVEIFSGLRLDGIGPLGIELPTGNRDGEAVV